MKSKSLLRQTAVLSAANGCTRALGFALRVYLSRRMGAEITGVLELAGSAHMLWLAPVTAGIPLAIATETAAGRGPQALRAGRRLSLGIALCMLPCLFALSPLIARALGDARTLPALWCYLPCLPVLAVSATLNGYFYGAGDTLPPSASELLEQGLRFGLCALFFAFLPRLSAGWTAALPALATLAGEAAGLLLALRLLPKALRRAERPAPGEKALREKLWRLAAPMTWMRLSGTLARTAGSILIPLRLRASGLGVQEATARLGLLSGMAMPWVMLPGIFTGALAMVAGPAIARRRQNPEMLGALVRRLLAAALAVSAPLGLAVSFGAPFLSGTVYRQAELAPLLRQLAPLVPLCGAQQVLAGVLTGLEKQSGLLTASLLGSVVTLTLDFFLVKKYRLAGCALARLAGHGVTLTLNLLALRGEMRKRGAATRPRGAGKDSPPPP